MAILKHIASKSSNYGAVLEYLIFKHDELRKTLILDQNGNRITVSYTHLTLPTN